MLDSDKAAQTYKFPSKQEAYDLFCEKNKKYYNKTTKILIDTIHKTLNKGLKDSFSDKSTSLCTSILFAIYPQTAYEAYDKEVLKKDPDYFSSIITMVGEIRSFFSKDLDSINQKLESAGSNPISATPEELEAISKFTIDYATYVVSDIYNFFSHVEKLSWKSAGMPDPRFLGSVHNSVSNFYLG